jgi:Cu/Ag efflux protein CusF
MAASIAMKSLDMSLCGEMTGPKMTMGFSVRDRTQLEGLKPGQAATFSLVHFRFERERGPGRPCRS